MGRPDARARRRPPGPDHPERALAGDAGPGAATAPGPTRHRRRPSRRVADRGRRCDHARHGGRDAVARDPEEPPAEKEAESDAKTTPESPLVPGKTGSDGAKVADLGETVVQEPARPVNPLDRARQPQTARAAGLPPTPGEKRQRGPLIAAAAAVTALVALAVYFLAFSGDDGKTPTRDSEPQAVTETTTARTTQTTRATPNSDISVFVLNGTTVNGLARGLANKLEQEGYTIKGTDTASDQTRAATLVMYANGKRSQALRVARSIGKGADVVEAIDPGAAALSQGASVVIVVGADQNVTNPG